MVAEVKDLHSNNADIERMQQIFAAQKAAYRQHPYPSAEQRIELINRIKPLLLDNLDAWIEALNNDFTTRAADETKLAEMLITLEGLKYTTKKLRKWMKPQKRSVSALSWPGKTWVEYQPVGVVGIIVPWNYPIQLAVVPLITALAAGNRVMVKMSEATPRTGALLEKLIADTFPEEQVAVINGEVDVAQAFSSLPFNHLLFTGSTTVGRHIMRAAAANLTPVTLELGGKSPAVVSPDVPMEDAAQRIAFGKAFNAGQTCVAPDYVLCPADRVQSFVDEFRARFSEMYPSLRDNDDFTAIINERQYDRLQSYLEDAREKGAELVEINPARENLKDGTRKIPLTLVLKTTPDMKVMQDEIFGPILPVVSYGGLDEAIHYINDRPRPLALYFFGYDKTQQQHVVDNTHSGGMCINDSLMHVAQDDLPFGGIGDSGMGHYHGREGFLTFSHHHAIFTKQKFNSGKFVYAPHGTTAHKMVYKFFIR